MCGQNNANGNYGAQKYNSCLHSEKEKIIEFEDKTVEATLVYKGKEIGKVLIVCRIICGKQKHM